MTDLADKALLQLEYKRTLKQLECEAKTQALFAPNSKVCRHSRQAVKSIGAILCNIASLWAEHFPDQPIIKGLA